MRRVRFTDPAGSTRVGEWTDDGIETGTATHAVDAVDVLAPVAPTKVIGVGQNYHGRHEEGALPEQPNTWLKGDASVVSGHGDTVTIPDSGEVVYEAELGVVIGEQCRNVTADEAMDVVAGFTCVNDLSDMAHADEPTFFRTKVFDNAAPMGPVVASPDLVPETPRARLWVNGDLEQDSAGDEFVFSVPEVVADVASRLTLEPDDVIMMGNPGDFSPLEDGDEVAIEIEGIGRLEHDVRVA